MTRTKDAGSSVQVDAGPSYSDGVKQLGGAWGLDGTRDAGHCQRCDGPVF